MITKMFYYIFKEKNILMWNNSTPSQLFLDWRFTNTKSKRKTIFHSFPQFSHNALCNLVYKLIFKKKALTFLNWVYSSVGVSPDSWVRQWVRVHKARVRLRVHQVRVRVHQVWIRVHWTRVRVRVHWTRVRVRVQWVRVRVRVRESNRSQSEFGLSLDSWVQQ